MLSRNPVSVVCSLVMFTAGLVSACSGPKVVPPELAEQIDKSVSFSSAKRSRRRSQMMKKKSGIIDKAKKMGPPRW